MQNLHPTAFELLHLTTTEENFLRRVDYFYDHHCDATEEFCCRYPKYNPLTIMIHLSRSETESGNESHDRRVQAAIHAAALGEPHFNSDVGLGVEVYLWQLYAMNAFTVVFCEHAARIELNLQHHDYTELIRLESLFDISIEGELPEAFCLALNINL